MDPLPQRVAVAMNSAVGRPKLWSGREGYD
jgi:hypothetical protein